MAKTVDQFSSIEDFRLQYNQLATDVGEISGLKTDKRLNLVDALNSVEDKVFYFQEFVFTATASQTSFSGEDDFENTLRFRRNKIQVFVNDKHLDESDDYVIASPQGSAHTEIQLIGATYSGGLNVNDKLTLYSFTGSFLGVEIQDALVGYFTENLDGAIYNNNDEGVIINASISDATTVHTYALVGQGEYKIELAGNVYTQGNSLQDGAAEFNSTVGIDGNFRVGSSNTSKFDVAAATGNTQIDGTLEVDSTVGIDGNFRVGTGGTSLFDVAAATGNTTVDGTLDVAGLASLDGGIDVDGAFTVANTTGDISTTGGLDVDGATLLNGDVTLGDASTDTITITGDLGSSITLSTDNAYSIGEPLVKLANVHSTVFTGNLSGNVTGEVSTVANHAMSGLSDVNYTSSPVAGQILAWDDSAGYWEPVDPTNTTDNVSEGSNNKYFTDDRLDSLLIGTNGLTKTYVDNANGGDDDPLDGTVTFKLDYEVVSTAPVSAGSTSNGHLWFVV